MMSAALPALMPGLNADPAGFARTRNGALRISTRFAEPSSTNWLLGTALLLRTIAELKPPAAPGEKIDIAVKFPPATLGLKYEAMGRLDCTAAALLLALAACVLAAANAPAAATAADCAALAKFCAPLPPVPALAAALFAAAIAAATAPPAAACAEPAAAS
jgi:hypothetical protein